MDFDRDHDTRVRNVAFDWLTRQVSIHDDVLPRATLAQGFDFDGRRVPVIGPQGIFKLRLMQVPLSITTAPRGPYDDAVGSDNLLRYRYRGIDPTHRDNVGLRFAMHNGLPLVYLHGIVPGRYLAMWPVYVMGDAPETLTFSIAIDDAVHAGLLDLANEELRLYKRRAVSRLDRLNREAESIEQKLGHVYAALESGSVDIDDLAPRLKELRARQRELDEKKDEALDEMNQRGDSPLNPAAFRCHLRDLKGILQSTSFLERKTFIGSFIRRIDFNRQEVGIEYTMPIPVGGGSTKTTEVLRIRGTGSAGWIRTSDPSVNSRLLYH